MKKIFIILIAAVMVLSLAACGAKMVPPTEPTATPVQVSQTPIPPGTPQPTESAQAPAGKLGTANDAVLSEDVLTAELKVGQIVAIYLKENPSTGYTIKLSDVPAGLIKTKDEYAAEPVASGIVGSGGIHIYAFTADKAGQYKLTAGVYPPGKDAPEKTYDFTITVK